MFHLVENVSEVAFVTAHNNVESTDTLQTDYNFCHDKAPRIKYTLTRRQIFRRLFTKTNIFFSHALKIIRFQKVWQLETSRLKPSLSLTFSRLIIMIGILEKKDNFKGTFGEQNNEIKKNAST